MNLMSINTVFARRWPANAAGCSIHHRRNNAEHGWIGLMGRWCQSSVHLTRKLRNAARQHQKWATKVFIMKSIH